MVTIDSNRRSDRAQLILIGAIALAFILLGLVVVLNNIQYTQAVSSSAPGDDLEQVDLLEIELERAIVDYAESNESITDDEVESMIEGDFAEYYATSKASHRPVDVSIEEASVTGNNTVQVEYTFYSGAVTVTNELEVDLDP